MNKPLEIPVLTARQVVRFWSKVAIGEPTDCWLWTGNYTRNKFGGGKYGLFTVRNRAMRPHRIAYTLAYGPIPEWLTIDHVKAWGCTNSLCCNPRHLEAVTLRENKQRQTRMVTHCKNGHPLRRNVPCRPCARAYHLMWSARRQSKAEMQALVEGAD